MNPQKDLLEHFGPTTSRDSPKGILRRSDSRVSPSLQVRATPRGCLDEVRGVLGALGIEVTVRDERQTGRPIEARSLGELRPEQASAAKHLLSHDTGVLAATTAFGKTVVAAWLIARRAEGRSPETLGRCRPCEGWGW